MSALFYLACLIGARSAQDTLTDDGHVSLAAFLLAHSPLALQRAGPASFRSQKSPAMSLKRLQPGLSKTFGDCTISRYLQVPTKRRDAAAVEIQKDMEELTDSEIVARNLDLETEK